MKKTVLLLIIIVSLAFIFQTARAQETDQSVIVYFFWGDGCPHCAKEEPFLKQLDEQYADVQVRDFEIWHNSENRKLLQDVGKTLDINVSGVPVTVVGTQTFSGYLDDSTTGAEIKQAIEQCRTSTCSDPIASLVPGGGEIKADSQPTNENNTIPKTINVPIFGTLQTEHLSIPVLTVILGALDGFNPCAMWTLVFLIGLLVGMKDKRRMWILGGSFLVASAAVYFLFMAAWLNLLLFLGAIIWIRAAIGLLALGGGIYYLREYFTNKDESCKITKPEKRQRIFERLKRYTQEKSFWLALGGIVVLAAAVNLVELVCSAGLPAVYTQVLALSNLAHWQYYAYLLLYIFFFLLDDLIVFFIAMKTLQVTGLTTKYARASHLIGGIIMVLIGILLVLKPEWLMFG